MERWRLVDRKRMSRYTAQEILRAGCQRQRADQRLGRDVSLARTCRMSSAFASAHRCRSAKNVLMERLGNLDRAAARRGRSSTTMPPTTEPCEAPLWPRLDWTHHYSAIVLNVDGAGSLSRRASRRSPVWVDCAEFQETAEFPSHLDGAELILASRLAVHWICRFAAGRFNTASKQTYRTRNLRGLS